MESGSASEPEESMPWGRLAVAYSVVFLVQTIVGCWEMHTENVAEDSWGWRQSFAGFYLAGCMLPAVPSTLFGSRITNLITDRNAICLMVSCLAPFAIFLLPFILGPSDQKVRQIVLYSMGSTGFTVFPLVAAGLTKSLITKMAPPPFRQRAVGIMATASALGRTAGPLLASSTDAAHAGGYTIFALVLVLLGTVLLGYKALSPHEEVVAAKGSKNSDLYDQSASTSATVPGCDLTNQSASGSQADQECEDDRSASTCEGDEDGESDTRCASDFEGDLENPHPCGSADNMQLVGIAQDAEDATL
jgi:MFS family permease